MKRTIILVVSLFLFLLIPQVGFSQEEEPATEEVVVAETEHGSIPNYAIDDDADRPGESLVRGLINTGVIPEDQEDELNAGRGFPVYSSPKSPAGSTFSLGMPGSPEKPQAPVKPTL